MYGSLVFVRKIRDKTILTTIVNTSDLELLNLKSEHMYLCTGIASQLTISKTIDRDISEISKGQSINGVLKSPVWQNS